MSSPPNTHDSQLQACVDYLTQSPVHNCLANHVQIDYLFKYDVHKGVTLESYVTESDNSLCTACMLLAWRNVRATVNVKSTHTQQT